MKYLLAGIMILMMAGCINFYGSGGRGDHWYNPTKQAHENLYGD